MSRAQRTPAVRSFGVVGTLATPICPLASSTSATSVKVPPISTPIRQAMPRLPLLVEDLLSSGCAILLRDFQRFGRRPSGRSGAASCDHDSYPPPPDRSFLSRRRGGRGRHHPRRRGEGIHRCL